MRQPKWAGFRAVGIVTATLACLYATMAQADPFTDLVDRLGGLRQLDRSEVERAIGGRLAETSRSDAFVMYEARGVRLDQVIVTLVDLRMPVAGGTATAGPLLVLRLAGDCMPRAAIEDRYGPLAVTGIPRGTSTDEETGLTRSQSWGRLTFGFAERAPGCLSSVTFAWARPR